MQGRTYRYYNGTPLYPFGYGLSYASMQLSDLFATHEAARITVANCSDFEAEEVIQLYIKDNLSPDAPLHPVLCGFLRVRLASGEKQDVRIPISPRAFTVVTSSGERIPGSGSWTLYAGFGQSDPRTEELTGKRALSVSLR